MVYRDLEDPRSDFPRQIAALEARLEVYEGHKAKSDYDYLKVSDSIPQIKEEPSEKTLGDEAEEDEMSQLLRGVNHLNLEANVPEFYGGSSARAIVDAVDEEDEEEEEEEDDELQRSTSGPRFHAPELWKAQNLDQLTKTKVKLSKMPPKELADRYNTRFIQGYHLIIPLIDVESYMARYEDFWEGKPTEGKGYQLWTAVMFMVVALGHQACTVDSDPAIREQALADNVGETCFELAKLTFANVPFAGGDLSAVNSMLMAFLWLYNQQRLHEAYAMLGSVFRVGYAIGVHREIVTAKATSGEINGWMSSWWSIVRYEIELSCLMGRPFGLQLKEVDLPQFPNNVGATHLQYLEFMRQFSYLALDAYESVYSLGNRRSTVLERAAGLNRSDRLLTGWYERFKSEATWADQPHGMFLRLSYLNMRILLYRVFLALVVQQCKRGLQIKDTILTPAARCVDLSMLAIMLITTLPTAGNAVIQAAYHQILGYLWNATVTLLLFGTDKTAPEKLADKTSSRQEIAESLEKAIDVFTAHQEGVTFLEKAAKTTTKLIRKVISDGGRRSSATVSDSTLTDFSTPDQIQDFFSGLDTYMDDMTNPSSFQDMFVDPGFQSPIESAGIESPRRIENEFWRTYQRSTEMSSNRDQA